MQTVKWVMKFVIVIDMSQQWMSQDMTSISTSHVSYVIIILFIKANYLTLVTSCFVKNNGDPQASNLSDSQ